MRTEKQREASRRNGAKSRGPVSNEGKRRACQNGRKHGLSGTNFSEPSIEQRAALEQVATESLANLPVPVPPTPAVISRLADALWRQQSAFYAEGATTRELLNAGPPATPEQVSAHAARLKSQPLFWRYQAEAESAVRRMLRNLQQDVIDKISRTEPGDIPRSLLMPDMIRRFNSPAMVEMRLAALLPGEGLENPRTEPGPAPGISQDEPAAESQHKFFPEPNLPPVLSPTIEEMTVDIEGVPLHLAHPDEFSAKWVGQEEVMRQLLAAWLVLDPADLPMNPRLIGKPGVGKTTLAYSAASRLSKEIYILQATVDTRPEDLIVTPVIEGERKLRYVASPLVTAMIRGGIVILDEGNRMSEKSWATLAPLLDNRRYVESIVAGIKIKAHPNFRLVATMNDDASTFDLPEYIHSRLQPQILIDFPDRDEEMQILAENLPFASEDVLRYVTEFLQQAHANEERYSARDGINIARYALKLRSATPALPLRDALHTATLETLGGEALRYVPRA
jgi:MoxR-like ATPase